MEFLEVIGALAFAWIMIKLADYILRKCFGVELVEYVIREWFGVGKDEPPAAEEPEEEVHPCFVCLYWPECNGVDADTCEILRDWKKARDEP